MEARRGSRLRRPPRYIALFVAILALAFALGSLPRSQPGGSWLIGSYWVLYLVALFPLISVGVMIVIIGYLVLVLKDSSDAIGSGMAAKKKQQKKTNPIVKILVYGSFWGLAIAALYFRCGGIICQSPQVSPDLQKLIVANSGSGGGAGQVLSGILGISVAVSGIVTSVWFSWSFLGLILVGSVLLIRSYKVAFDEMREDAKVVVTVAHQQGLQAVNAAIRIVQTPEMGPKERIVACYNKMLKAASEMGAEVTPDQTARELERTIRRTFMLAGNGIRTLTNLFEEARYSIHTMTEEDSQAAHSSLMLIHAELQAV